MDVKQRKRAIEGMVTIHPAEDEHGMGFVCQIGPNACVVTAAHCLPRLVDPRIARGDPLTVEMSKLEDESVRAEALMRFVDPCVDAAILGDSNWQCDLFDLPNGDRLEDAYSTLCRRRRKLKICTKIPVVGQPFSVHIFTVDGDWVTGNATLGNRFSPQVGFTGEGTIRPGTSGAPAFNNSGEVIGIVSAGVTGENDEAHRIVLLASALPHWAVMELDEGGEGDLSGLPDEDRDEIAKLSQIDRAAGIRELMQQTSTTIEQIAEQCGMFVEEVRFLLEDDD